MTLIEMTSTARLTLRAIHARPERKRPSRVREAVKWSTGRQGDEQRGAKREDPSEGDPLPRRELQLEAAAHDDLSGVGAHHRRRLPRCEEPDGPDVQCRIAQRDAQRVPLRSEPDLSADTRAVRAHGDATRALARVPGRVGRGVE
eukprot:scaffold39115_cov65-Phaeocystis_antarctica.AAC.9